MYFLVVYGEDSMVIFNNNIRIRKIGTKAFLVNISNNKLISLSISAVDFLQSVIADGSIDKLEGEAKNFIDNLILADVLKEVE